MFCTPMKAAPFTRLPHDPDRWVLQPKLDGWRAIAGVHDAGAWIEVGHGTRVSQTPYLLAQLTGEFPADTVLDGEIYDARAVPQRARNRTQTILSRNRAHVPTPADPGLTYTVFDVLVVEGRDLRGYALADRLVILGGLFAGVQAHNITLLESFACEQQHLDRLLKQGYEGAVVKDLATAYIPGGRRGEWGKIKPDHEIEAVCTGTYAPTAGSKYDGNSVGGISFQVQHADGTRYNGRAAGMDDQLRGELYRAGLLSDGEQTWRPKGFVGLVVELTHKGVQPGTGALLSPQYRRFRAPADKTQPEVPPAGLAQRMDAVRTYSGAVPGAVFTSSTPKPKREATPRHKLVERDGGTRGKRKMRNYAAMGTEKLARCRVELELGPGYDAFDRCVDRGSGDPAGDLAVIGQLMGVVA